MEEEKNGNSVEEVVAQHKEAPKYHLHTRSKQQQPPTYSSQQSINNNNSKILAPLTRTIAPQSAAQQLQLALAPHFAFVGVSLSSAMEGYSTGENHHHPLLLLLLSHAKEKLLLEKSGSFSLG